jgi:predicted TPR repeat methyltransferase
VNADYDQNEQSERCDIASLMREGDEHLREGRGTPAESCFRKILEHQPDNPDALHRCGMIAYLRGAPGEAAELLGRAAAIVGDDATLHGHLASALMACGELDEAIACWHRALACAPGYAGAYVKLGDAYYAKGDMGASEDAYRKSIEMTPDDARAYVGLGRVLHFLNKNREAEDALHRALELGDGAPDVCLLVGTVVLEAGGVEAALELFEAVVRADPDEPQGHASMGLALHWLGRIDDAQAAYRRALDIDPRQPLALKHLGVLYQERDQLDAAAECFEKLLQAYPEDDVARHMLAATSGETPASAPAGYVTRVYDDYADRFDAHLGTIAYRVPELIRDAVEEVTDTHDLALRVLDLGCGTGLCGEAVRPLASYLAGVDLSPRMIAKADERKIYDSLTVASMEDALAAQAQAFDLIVAGDVFICVGDLSELVASCARALRPGGLIAFSIESADGDSYRLRPTGRYAHSVAYIDTVAANAGLAVDYRQDIVVRNDTGPISGQIVVLKKAAQGTMQ